MITLLELLFVLLAGGMNCAVRGFADRQQTRKMQ